MCNAHREADKDMVVAGYRVPKGTVLTMPPYTLHLSPHNFTAPEQFLPARWLNASDLSQVVDPGGQQPLPAQIAQLCTGCLLC